ncbi:MAG: hypothetical protein CFE43_13330 [Burkholderiales bacterium PBB3]|nr:MAG: hypothetical protein CFE43_13330 [Burkholderiales bacterium PBB3]
MTLLAGASALCAQAVQSAERAESPPEVHLELLAQAAPGRPVAVEREVRILTPGGDSGAGLGGMLGNLGSFAGAGSSGSGREVKGAPYCADAVHESTQYLIDPASSTPNKIVRKNSSTLCRDSEGRTRQEIDGAGRKQIFLRDPVAKESWMLDPERKTAIRLGAMQPMAPGAQPGDSGAWREYGERMRDWARDLSGRVRHEVVGVTTAVAPMAPPVPPVPPIPAATPLPEGGPSPVYVTRNETVSPDGKQRQVEVHVIRRGAGDAALTPLPDMAPPAEVMLRAESMARRGAGVVSALPAKELEGVKVNGERTTWTIEAGKIGNEKAIVQTREVWTSPELMLTVYSKDVDPRSGETVYRLSKLSRKEPDASLFKVPQGYEVTEPTVMPRVLRPPKAAPTPAPAPSARG